MSENNCSSCKNGKLHRNHVCEDYVIWHCDSCDESELEEFESLDDEGWKWLRSYYKSTPEKIKMVAIGYMGEWKVYINISAEEALKRYNAEYDENYSAETINIKELEVEDSFYVYDIWE